MCIKNTICEKSLGFCLGSVPVLNCKDLGMKENADKSRGFFLRVTDYLVLVLGAPVLPSQKGSEVWTLPPGLQCHLLLPVFETWLFPSCRAFCLCTIDGTRPHSPSQHIFRLTCKGGSACLPLHSIPGCCQLQQERQGSHGHGTSWQD